MALDPEAQTFRAPRQSLNRFMAWSKGNMNSPSYNNRYSVSFTTPNILRSGKYVQKGFDLEFGDNQNLLNFYATNINLPSKQVTTGSITSVGSTFNYATSSTFSQINISFLMPRSGKTRTIFERWISIMSNDANQYVDYYDDYVCPNLKIYKWERGGGPELQYTQEFWRLIRELGINEDDVTKFRDDQLLTVYDLRNVFPVNIGSMTLSNDQANLMMLDVTFNYERYRYYGPADLDSDGSPYIATGGASPGAKKPQATGATQSRNRPTPTQIRQNRFN